MRSPRRLSTLPTLRTRFVACSPRFPINMNRRIRRATGEEFQIEEEKSVTLGSLSVRREVEAVGWPDRENRSDQREFAMTETNTCPKCGKILPADAPVGVCPKCLLAAGLDSFDGEGIDRPKDCRRPTATAPVTNGPIFRRL